MALNLKTKKQRTARRIVIAGQGGVGKSTLVGGMVDKPLLIDYDDRWPEAYTGKTGFLAGTDDFDSLRKTLLGILEEKTLPYDSIVIDTGTKLMEAVERYTINKDCDGSKDKYNAYSFGLKFSPQYFSEILALLEDIERKHGTNTIIICHTKIRQISNPTGEDYSKVGMDLPDAVQDRLFNWADLVGYARFETFVKVVDKKKPGKAQGGTDRIISFNPQASFVAKNGTGLRLPDDIPLIEGEEKALGDVLTGKTGPLWVELNELLTHFPKEDHPTLDPMLSVEQLQSFITEGRKSLKKGAK